jgi:hypothetical protein
MMAATVARRPDAPICFDAFQFGRICLNALDNAKPSSRRYHVRPWRPTDGGVPGWRFRRGYWIWSSYLPRHAGEFVTIVRLCDGTIAIAPRRWWKCDPHGMPVDTDWWAEAAWRAIEVHYEAQRNWYFGAWVSQ